MQSTVKLYQALRHTEGYSGYILETMRLQKVSEALRAGSYSYDLGRWYSILLDSTLADFVACVFTFPAELRMKRHSHLWQVFYTNRYIDL